VVYNISIELDPDEKACGRIKFYAHNRVCVVRADSMPTWARMLKTAGGVPMVRTFNNYYLPIELYRDQHSG